MNPNTELKSIYGHEYWIKNKERLTEYNLLYNEKLRNGRPKIKERRHNICMDLLKSSFSLGYVLGAIYGDGSIFIGKDGQHGHCTISATDKEFIDYFKENLRKIFPYHISEDTQYPKNLSKKISFRVSFSGRQYATFFNNYNLESIKNADIELIKGFLKGYYDSEGCACYSNIEDKSRVVRQITFTQKDYEIILLIRFLLSKLFITSTLTEKKGSGFNPNGIYYKIIIQGKDNFILFKENIGFSIRRKQDKLDIMINSFMKPRNCVICHKAIKPKSFQHIFCEDCKKINLMEYQRNYSTSKNEMKRDGIW